jgi:hypothetical protein
MRQQALRHFVKKISSPHRVVRNVRLILLRALRWRCDEYDDLQHLYDEYDRRQIEQWERNDNS